MDQTPLQNLPFITRQMLNFEQGTAFSLQITSNGNSASRLTIRGMTRAGLFTFQHNVASQAGAAQETFRIPDLPIWISVIDTDGDFGPGECFVQLSLLANNDEVISLLSGYVMYSGGLSWPGTTHQQQTPTNGNFTDDAIAQPAANTTFTFTVRTGQIIRPLAIRIPLVTDGNAANRTVSFIFQAWGSAMMHTIASVVQTASTTRYYVAAPFPTLAAASDATDINMSMPAEFYMRQGDTLTATVQNMQATDRWGAGDITYLSWAY